MGRLQVGGSVINIAVVCVEVHALRGMKRTDDAGSWGMGCDAISLMYVQHIRVTNSP